MRLVALLSLAVVAVGCAHGQRAYADATTSSSPEPLSMWARPQEMGYTLGDRIEGEATKQCVLGFICWGADDGGIAGQLTGIIGALTGQAVAADPLVRAAAAGAVLAAGPDVDGIYVLNHETDDFNIYVYSRRSAKVVGKSVKLHPLGEVSQDRADKERFLKAMSGANIHMPSSFADVH